MQAVDRAAIERFKIPRILLMEQAGKAVAEQVQRRVRTTPPAHRPIIACCGIGFNGGDGLCAARYLASWGYPVRVVLAGTAAHLKDEPAIYLRILRALGVPIQELTNERRLDALSRAWRHAAVIIDAVLGIGLRGPVRPLQASLIAAINHARRRVVAVDVPSGLDADTGLPQPVAVRATVTVTFGLPKIGCLRAQGPAHVGTLIIEEIGFPQTLLHP